MLSIVGLEEKRRDTQHYFGDPVYTRKSSEEGLQQEFNSLDAQCEAGVAYVRSQTGEGWRLLETGYDDGGVSGGTLDRPALRRLLDDIAAGKDHVVVVYKVDRLTRSLGDFAKLVEVFESHGVSFVSVTQQCNDVDGTTDAERPALFCAVRARGHRRTHSRQDHCLHTKGHVDGRGAAYRVRGQG